MFAVTDAACAAMAGLLADADVPENDPAVIRLFYGQQGLGLALDQVQPNDRSFQHDGSDVLVVEEQLAETLDNQTLDVEDSEQGPSLMLRGSDAASSNENESESS